MAATPSSEEARGVYDRIGSRLDRQHFYEAAATSDPVDHVRFRLCRGSAFSGGAARVFRQ